ncbi:VOC family protein [Novosphingobium sp. FSY-8]|uniref:VOC family protein n=1 Tax=Novosphingobium ovatum TaxID=1908523 RepID=A0ABW9XGC6_9SPHN|nr:VOC family protein [Novosphingobium ovatum]NBC37599.1 VOC family protein [Novosphingobium ovatum]
MIGYVTLGTNDLERAARFYDAIATELGVGRMIESAAYIAWGDVDGAAGIGVTVPFDGAPASAGNGVMIALEAASAAQVDRIHALALALGGSCEGAPGLRGEGFYAGYFRDPDGNKLNAFVIS